MFEHVPFHRLRITDMNDIERQHQQFYSFTTLFALQQHVSKMQTFYNVIFDDHKKVIKENA